MTRTPNTQNLPSTEEILNAARKVAENTIGEPKTLTTQDIIRQLHISEPFQGPRLSQHIAKTLREHGFEPLARKTTRYRRYKIPLLTSS